MELSDFIVVFEWYGVADGEAGTTKEEKAVIMKLYNSLSEEDREAVYNDNWEEIDDIIKALK